VPQGLPDERESVSDLVENEGSRRRGDQEEEGMEAEQTLEMFEGRKREEVVDEDAKKLVEHAQDIVGEPFVRLAASP
jgi:hypothetical protein